MKLAYVVRTEIPQQAAHTVHTMKLSEQFAEMVDNFELVIAQSETDQSVQDEYAFYGVKRFTIKRLKRRKYLWAYIFAFKAIAYILKNRFDAVVTRDPLLAFLCVVMHKRVVLDLHGEIAQLCGRAYRIMKWDFFRYSKYLNLVAITNSLTTYYKDKYGVDKSKFTVLADGCTLENYEAYKSIPLLENDILSIAYVGSLGEGRGFDIIQKIAEELPEVIIHIYGGMREKAVQLLNGGRPSDNIVFHGYVPNSEIPEILSHQDILLLPYKNRLLAMGEDTGKVMSPLKLFEYMASGRVILSSDLLVLREILNDENSYLVNAEDWNAWVQAIKQVDKNRTIAREKALRAQEDVRQYTWQIRANKMLKLIVKS